MRAPNPLKMPQTGAVFINTLKLLIIISHGKRQFFFFHQNLPRAALTFQFEHWVSLYRLAHSIAVVPLGFRDRRGCRRGGRWHGSSSWRAKMCSIWPVFVQGRFVFSLTNCGWWTGARFSLSRGYNIL